MRTRNTDSPKSGQGKKAAQAKKETPAAEKAQEAAPKPSPKLTPKTSSGAKAARVKPSTPKAATTAEADEANALVTTESDEIKTPVVDSEKSLEKKVRVKAKSPLGGKAASSSITNEKEKFEESSAKSEGEEIKEDAADNLVDLGKEQETKGKDAKNDSDKGPSEAVVEVIQEGVTAKKDELETNTEVNNEYDVNDDNEDQQVEDEIEQDGLNEADEDFPSAEVGEEDAGEGVEGVGDDEERTKIEEEEQVQISDMAKARKIKKELEIFVGGLDRDAVEDDLRKTFEKVGEVVEVRLHKDYATNKNKGFAFVKFASKEHVARALEVMKNPMIRGKRCGIAPSEDNDTLFLGNICNTWTKDAIKRKLKDYGIDSVENITLVADTQNEGLSRGFAFLEFSCHVDAMAAYKRLQKPDVIFGHPERTAKVAFGEPLREPDPEVMAQVKSVFVDGLPPYWDEDQVKDHFKSFGEIERVVLARNMSTAKRKDFGFVNFTSHEAAVACVEGVNDTELGDDGKSKMKARARLANPLPKTQAVKGGMSGGFRIGHNGIGVYSRFGRGVGRGRFSSNRAGFQGGRVFYSHGRGRGGRFGEVEMSYPDFCGWKPYGVRGGRRGSSASGRFGAFDRGRGRGFPSRRPTYTPEKDFSGHFGTAQYGENPYYYGGGRGLKRPLSMMEHEPSYLESTNRLRPRYDIPDPLTGGSRYRDSLGASGLYSRDYFGSDYGGSSYSSFYGGEPSGGGYYY